MTFALQEIRSEFSRQAVPVRRRGLQACSLARKLPAARLCALRREKMNAPTEARLYVVVRTHVVVGLAGLPVAHFVVHGGALNRGRCATHPDVITCCPEPFDLGLLTEDFDRTRSRSL